MAGIGHQTAFTLLKRECKGGVVLDVGAFPGTLTRMLAGAGFRVVALDKAPDRGLTIQTKFHQGEALDAHEETFAAAMHAIGVDTREADIELTDLPVESGSADAVVLTEVIEHLFVNPLLALTEINRSLKDGGVLLLSTPNLLSLRNRFNFMRGEMSRVIQPPFNAFLQKVKIGHCGHVRTYAPDELAVMLRSLGFEPAFHFYSFDFWDMLPDEPPASVGTQHPPGRVAVAEGPVAALGPKKPSIFRKLFRSPASYVGAGISTVRVILEKIFPQFRPHMFVIARKTRSVTFADLKSAPLVAQQ